MSDITLSPQTIALVGTLLSALVATIVALATTVTILYRQVLQERDGRLDERNRVLDERDARLVDLWRDLEEKEIRIASLEGANERLQRLATDAMEGWKLVIEETKTRES